MYKIIIKFILLCLFIPAAGLSQNYDYGFTRQFDVPVKDSALQLLHLPWVGGLNSCTFNQIDLNTDGIKDLVVFDKTGDRLLTFINNGTPDSIDYTYAPQYQHYFPEFTGWIQLRDYNCDGKEDIFAYATAGMQVWKNISDTTLKFVQVTPLLNSYQGWGYSNIMLTYVDYPAIEDIDGDGDLDILVFFGLGAHINMHKNMSMELFGNCDSLEFELTFNCWGNFAESESSNHLFLNITCPWKCGEQPVNPSPGKEAKHTGSTMLLLDANNDGLKDMVLGDIDYKNLVLLINGGNTDTAHMISADESFPSNTTPVDLVSFAAACYLDIDNDSVNELLISPFEPNPVIPESYHSVWLYENTGVNNQPVFEYITGNFLQSEMIETGTGAFPVCFDQNGDSLMDIVIGNYGYLDSSYFENGFLRAIFQARLALYRNTGTATDPEFTLITRDFANIAALGLQNVYPAFGDLDGDGDQDMLCGNSDGKLYYFQNTAGTGNPAAFALSQTNYQGIDVGDFSAPFLVDLNGSGLLDLVIGKKSGMLSYYENTGSASNPVFTLVTDTLGGVNVTNYLVSYSGYSAPCFFRDSLGLLKLFVGSESGKIYYYKDIEANLSGNFTATDSILIYLDEESETRFIRDGMRSGAAVHNFNNDAYMDMVVGNFAGGLTYYSGTVPQPFSSVEEALLPGKNVFTVYPNPASKFVRLSGDAASLKYPVALEILNISGSLAAAEKFNPGDEATMDITTLSPGIYIYRIFSANGNQQKSLMQTGKLVIIR